MVFVLNIGNTNTQYALFDDGQITDYDVCATVELSQKIIPEGIPVAASTVVPQKKELFSDTVFWVRHDVVKSVNLALVERKSVGADRLANAVALAHEVSLPAICIDCGTAITFEVIDDKRYFYGGAIAPGRKLLRKSLNSYTALLPDVPIVNDIKKAIGTNTKEAILSGTDIGVVYMVKGLVEQIKVELGTENCDVVITGGDAPFFLKHIPEAINGGIDFTLKGIGYIYQDFNC